MYPYRVFISYSRRDPEAAAKIYHHLESLGLRPMWDLSLTPAERFAEEITERIAFAHIFIPLLTPYSARRPWVNQEIGYAVGVNVPVLPLALGQVPVGIIGGIQPVHLAEDLSDLRKRISSNLIERVVARSEEQHRASFELAEQPQDRTRILAAYAKRVLALDAHGRVRQRAAFSSFCLPDRHPRHAIWRSREGKSPRTVFYRTLRRDERRSLEEHVRECGCDLIIHPYISLKAGNRARKVRLRTLVEFLESMPDEKVRVVVRKKEKTDNLLIVGDWFVAHSPKPRPGVGYMYTVLTRHAPTVFQRVRQFDDELEELLKGSEHRKRSSRLAAIARLKAIIERIKG